MALQGELGAFSLPDILRLIGQTRQSGRLTVAGSNGRSEVHVIDGKLAALLVRSPLRAHDLAHEVLELFLLTEGSFAFDPLSSPEPPPGHSVDLAGVLRSATDLLAQWRELERVVPDLDHTVAIVPTIRDTQVTIPGRLWPILTSAVHQPAVVDIGRRHNLGRIETARALQDLALLGLVQIHAPHRERTPRARQRA